MRRLLAVLLVLSPALGGASLVAASPAGAEAPVGTDHRGLRYTGLTRSSTDSTCRGGFELAYKDRVDAHTQQILCTHGPDPAPDGVDVLRQRGPETAAAGSTAAGTAAPGTAAAAGTVPCYGTGSDGYRVELLYARSVRRRRPLRHVRLVVRHLGRPHGRRRQPQRGRDRRHPPRALRHRRLCNPVIDRVTLSANGASDFNTMISELRAQGFNRSDRKYVVWVDANVYCGIAQVYSDDSANPAAGANASNGNP